MEPVVVAVLIGVGAYLLVIAVIPKRFLSEPNRYTKSVLAQLEKEAYGKTAPVEDTLSIMREQLSKAGVVTRAVFTLPGANAMYPRLVKAGLADSTDKFFTMLLIIMLLIVYGLKGWGVWSVPAALVITYFLGWRYVRNRIRKRNGQFLNSFPDALDMIVRSVRSGYPLNAAVRMVSENMQPPVSNEFKQVADETAYGSTLMEALNRLSKRIDEPDIRFFVVVLAVQQEVGGNLAEVLSNLSSIIRKRRYLRMKIKALTSEGRATAWVLGILPLFVFGLIHMVSPHHLDPFFYSPLGNILLITAIGIVLLGMFIVNKMVNVEV